ncbi:hypothetical protein OH77DRAFT_467051 [Trametes cingulata]|nr:hypothetical protein OH77DRAFT_467051 [Trametes cingulata]
MSQQRTTRVSLPGPILDVHDLAVLILRAHATVAGGPFADARLMEVSQNGEPFQRLPSRLVPPAWFDDKITRKVAYVLYDVPAANGNVTVDAFPVQPVVSGVEGETPTRKALEDIFWRCKNYKQNYLLAYVAQSIFERLPSNTLLHCRTATGYTLLCHPRDVRLGTATITPREACAILHLSKSPKKFTAFLSGFHGPISWPYLVLGNDPNMNRRVVLDLALPGIGGRGLGGELFALERHDDYQCRVLPKYAVVHDRRPLSLGLSVAHAHQETVARARAVTRAVLAALVAILEGEMDFCRYCGKPGVPKQCGGCRAAHFCAPCQLLGWRYHREWCWR